MPAILTRAIAVDLPQSNRLGRIEAAAWKFASKKRAWLIAFVLIPVALRLALLPWIPPPQAGIQDEFSYLLASDTYVSGHLTNPPHPFWVFFESAHIIQQPTYMSKYPPLTGFILAFGQRVFRNPWIGVLMSMGALCGVMAWAMQNWLPPLWALIGTTLAVLKIGILSYWSESYWGGAGAAIGGTLLVGSLPCIIRRPTWLNGMPAAIGIALLANSRPYEGLLLTVLCLGYAAWQIIRRANSRGVWIRNLIRAIGLPIIAVMIPVGSWMAFNNIQVTGNALVMPYVAHDRQYAAVSPFFWEHPKAAPVYRHEALRQVWINWDLKKKTVQRQYFLLTRFLFLAFLQQFYLGIPLVIVIIAGAPAVAKSHRTKAAFWLMVLFLAGLNLELGFLPHYAAPATILFYIVAASALRWLRHWRPERAGLAKISYVVSLAVVGVQLLVGAFLPQHRFLYDKRGFQAERARILEFLNGVPGKQLIFVRYGPNHDLNDEWVYNRADIDGSTVVWARSMGPEKDRALISYFKDRHVWLLEENGAARISSYGSADHLAEKVSSAARSPGT